MKVGQISYSYKPVIGGCEIYVDLLKDLLNKRGYSQKIYQVRRQGLKDKEIRQVPVAYIFRRKPLYFYNLFLNIFLHDLVREKLLIVHDPFHYWPVIWHRKVVVISHGVRWKRPQKEQLWYNRVHYWSARFAFKFAFKLVANDSDFFRKLGIRLKPKEKMFQEITKDRWFIPNCVDTKKFKKSDILPGLLALNPILVPRNIVRGRGIHLAILAFKEFRKKFKNTNLVICGDFSDVDYKYEIFNLIRELGLVGSVYFVGSIDWNLMPRIYSSSLMTIIPTLYEEGTSLAALESMSCGTPVVSTNVGGLVDLPTLQAKAESKDLAQKMIRCFGAREKYSNQQQNEVRRIYNLENFKAAWLSVLED